MIRNPNHGERCVIGGAIGGMAGAFALLAVRMVTSLLWGGDLWFAVKTAALPMFGARVFEPGFDFLPVVFGLSNHFAIAMVWGVMFAVLAYGLARPATVAAAMGWGLVTWLGMMFIALPLLGWADLAMATPLGQALIGHLVFGLALGLAFLPFQRPRLVGGTAELAPA